MVRAIYPGTFDPIHNGHIDIARRASYIFDELVLAVYDTPPKKLLFSTEERVAMAEETFADLDNVTVMSYTGLTVQCARNADAQVIVRGLRNVADFEFEYQIGLANREMAPDIELCCLVTSSVYAFLSATILKEVASLDGGYESWTPEHVRKALQRKYAKIEPPTSKKSVAELISKTRGKLSHHG
jgi:pantetheine-phosphate adenylyltransferase